MLAWRFRFRGSLGGSGEASHSCRKGFFHLLGIRGGQLILLAEGAVRPRGGNVTRGKTSEFGNQAIAQFRRGFRSEHFLGRPHPRIRTCR